MSLSKKLDINVFDTSRFNTSCYNTNPNSEIAQNYLKYSCGINKKNILGVRIFFVYWAKNVYTSLNV